MISLSRAPCRRSSQATTGLADGRARESVRQVLLHGLDGHARCSGASSRTRGGSRARGPARGASWRRGPARRWSGARSGRGATRSPRAAARATRRARRCSERRAARGGAGARPLGRRRRRRRRLQQRQRLRRRAGAERRIEPARARAASRVRVGHPASRSGSRSTACDGGRRVRLGRGGRRLEDLESRRGARCRSPWSPRRSGGRSSAPARSRRRRATRAPPGATPRGSRRSRRRAARASAPRLPGARRPGAGRLARGGSAIPADGRGRARGDRVFFDAPGVARRELPIEHLEVRIGERAEPLRLSCDRVLELLEALVERARACPPWRARGRARAAPRACARRWSSGRRAVAGFGPAGAARRGASACRRGSSGSGRARWAGGSRSSREEPSWSGHLGEGRGEVQRLQNDRRRRQAEGRRERAQIEPHALVALRRRAVDRPVEELVGPEARRPSRARSPRERTTRRRPGGRARAASSANSGVTPAIASRPSASPAVVMYPASRTVDGVGHAKHGVARVEERVLGGEQAIAAARDSSFAQAKARDDTEGVGCGGHGVGAKERRRQKIGQAGVHPQTCEQEGHQKAWRTAGASGLRRRGRGRQAGDGAGAGGRRRRRRGRGRGRRRGRRRRRRRGRGRRRGTAGAGAGRQAQGGGGLRGRGDGRRRTAGARGRGREGVGGKRGKSARPTRKPRPGASLIERPSCHRCQVERGL